jgi:hypothetical protein
VLPGVPSHRILEAGFTPKLSELGHRHPVTAELPGLGKKDGPPTWGRWFRELAVDKYKGNVVMTGADDQPLLLLDRVGKGRVAQIFSDNIWLWARGVEGGGPHSELLRRLSHWLMKEPQLEENDLKAEIQGRNVKIIQRSLNPTNLNVLVTKPGGEVDQITLADEGHGRASGVYSAPKTGLYRITDGEHTVLVGVGGLNPVEFADLRTTTAKLEPAVNLSGGGFYWTKRDGVPIIRHLDTNRQMHGHNWMGMRKNGDYSVTGVKQNSILPPYLFLALALMTILAAWVREGR